MQLYFGSDTCVVVVNSSLGQRLIRHEWKVSLLDVRLSKSVRTKAQRHFQNEQYLIRGRFVPPTKRHLFLGKEHVEKTCLLHEVQIRDVKNNFLTKIHCSAD